MRLRSDRSRATISRSDRTRWPSCSSRTPTCAVADEWTREASGGRGTGSSSRHTARRPLRVQTTIRPLVPIPGQTSISPASRSRFSRAAVTARPVPAHEPTTCLGTTPNRATNSRTSRSRLLIRSVLLPGTCLQDVADARFDTAATSPSGPARRRSRPRTHHIVCVRGRLRPKGSKSLLRRSGCGQHVWVFVRSLVRSAEATQWIAG